MNDWVSKYQIPLQIAAMTAALVVLGGYLLGSMPFGYWLVLLLKGEDIRTGRQRQHRRKRTSGARTDKGYGIPIVVLDVAKGFVPAFVGTILVGPLVGVLAGGAAMLGHWRPLFLRFQKGGKTVATGGGTFLGVVPLLGLIGVAIWLVVFLVFRYASLASMVTGVALPVRRARARGAVAGDRLRRDRGRRRARPAQGQHRPPARGNREPLPLPARAEARL